MPTIVIDGPPIEDLDTKRALVKEMSDAAVRAYGIPLEAMVVLIRENDQDNVGVGGILIRDRRRRPTEGQED